MQHLAKALTLAACLLAIGADSCQAEKKKGPPPKAKLPEIMEAGPLVGGRIGTGGVPCVAVCPKQKYVAAGGHYVRVWDDATGEIAAELKTYHDGVRSMSFSGDGRYLATAAFRPLREPAKIWETKTWKLFRQTDIAAPELCFLRGRNVLVGRIGEEIRLYDLDRDAIVRTFDTGAPSLSCMGLSANDALIAVGGGDGVARVLDLHTGKLVQRVDVHKGPVQAVALSDDGELLATCGDSPDIKVWKVRDATVVSQWRVRGRVRQMLFQPRTHRLAIASGALALYDARTGVEVAMLRAQFGIVAESAAFYPLGDQLIAGCGTSTVHWRKGVGEKR